MTDTTPPVSDAPAHDTRATHITLFEDRAQVTRRARIEATPGQQSVVLGGFSMMINDPSLTVEPITSGSTAARVLTARVKRVAREEREVGVDELRDRTRERDGARAALERLSREIERAHARVTRARALEAAALSQLAHASVGDPGEVQPWREALDSLREEIMQAALAEARLRADADAARATIARAEARLAQASVVHHRYEATVEVQLELLTDEADELELELTYFVPCALWRPTHRAALVRDPQDPSRGTITVLTQGAVWQRTGELWEDVTCAFSTARPTQAAEPPRLRDDHLYTRPKTEYERRTIDVSAQDITISTAGVAGGTRQVNEMPGVDDGGEPLQLAGRGRATIPGHGQVVRVPLGEQEIPCKVELVAFPEQTRAVHLRATGAWSAPYPLLAGPVVLLREGAMVGRAPTRFVGAGDTFELGFGVESALSVQRKTAREDVSKKLSRRVRTQHTTSLYLSNLSGRPITFTLIERLPVSEIAEVIIERDPTTDDGGTPDTDGFLHIPVTLDPRQTATRQVIYTVDRAGNVNLSF